MRAFVAIALNQPVADEISRLQSALSGQLPGANWTSRQNLHITLAFFDALPSIAEETVAGMLDEIASTSTAPSLHLSALGAFPSIWHPNVLWCGVNDIDSGLSKVQSRLSESLRQCEIAFDERPYSPHCTIGRVRRRWPDSTRKVFAELIAKYSTFQTRPWRPDSLHLYKSHNGYELLHRSPLTG